MSEDVTVNSETSEVPDTRLWSLSATVASAKGPKPGLSSFVLGEPRDSSRWMALVRLWSPWLAPEQGKSTFSPLKDVVLCSFLLRNGLNLCFLALSGMDDVLSLFRADEDGNVLLTARNDGLEKGTSRVLVSVGASHESTVAAVMYLARRIVESQDVMKEEAQSQVKTAMDEIKPQWYENWYDGFTYCTWNGLGQNLKEHQIYDALKSLEDNKINITNLIIDDNWQSLDNEGESQFRRGWTDFDANKEGFPKGLKHTVYKIRQDYPHIQHISVWHAILGYWGGIAPKGNISKNYKTINVNMKTGVRPPGGPMVVVDEEDVPRLYEDFYKFLTDCGIDSVKTDAQFFLDELEDADVRRRLIKTYQDAWTVSSLKWFSIKAISYFFPEIPASHPWHIFCNAHNAILTRYLNLLPDWDMFQTDHPWSTFHGAARCLSGGPIYVTDEPGKHDIGLIHQMTAPTIRGNTVIIRPQCLGRSMLQYVHYDEERLLRVGTYSGPQKLGTGMLGLFNVSDVGLTELVPINEFPGIEEGYEYIVRSHFSGEISHAMVAKNEGSLISLHVQVHGCEILSSYPLRPFQVKSSGQSAKEASSTSELKVANLGLLGKMTGAAAVLGTEFTSTEAGNLKIRANIRALGVLGLYISDLSSRTIEEDFLVLILGRVVPVHTVKVNKASNNVLEVDIEKAWEEMDLQSNWSNELEVTIVVTGSAVISGL
ncbi:MAG: hypothetical protein M4579_000168 [Chaenotheca gracillima]|nr:MAG: hypothetical protein M4579_000168 [Chaenotheca gracillima]